jgi:hypothetical protein
MKKQTSNEDFISTDVADRKCRILSGKKIIHVWPAHGIFMNGRCTSCLLSNTAHLISIHVTYFTKLTVPQIRNRRCQCPRGFKRRSRVRIPPRAWMPVSCKRCVLSGRDLCDGLIPHPEESYRVCVCVTERDEVQQQTLCTNNVYVEDVRSE